MLGVAAAAGLFWVSGTGRYQRLNTYAAEQALARTDRLAPGSGLREFAQGLPAGYIDRMRERHPHVTEFDLGSPPAAWRWLHSAVAILAVVLLLAGLRDV